MPTPDYDTTRYALTDRYRRVAQVLPALRADATLRRSLRLFGRLKKWTVTLWAARGGYSEDTAARELRALDALYPKIPNVIRAPTIVLGQPVCTVGGL